MASNNKNNKDELKEAKEQIKALEKELEELKKQIAKGEDLRQLNDYVVKIKNILK